MTDFALSASLLTLAGLLLLAYGLRVHALGGVQSARVDREGSSSFLGRTPMLVAYWAIVPIGRCLARWGVTANAVTALSLVLGASSGLALGSGRFGVGACLFVTSSLCDALDGFIARETGTQSASGETFDAAVDRYNDFFLLAGLAIFYRQNAPMLALVLLALLGSFMVSYATAKAEAMRVTAPRGSMRRVERATYLIAGIGFVPIVGSFRAEFADAPVMLALLLVGTVANASAVRRLVRIAELLRARDEQHLADVVGPALPPGPPRELGPAPR